MWKSAAFCSHSNQDRAWKTTVLWIVGAQSLSLGAKGQYLNQEMSMTANTTFTPICVLLAFTMSK